MLDDGRFPVGKPNQVRIVDSSPLGWHWAYPPVGVPRNMEEFVAVLDLLSFRDEFTVQRCENKLREMRGWV